MARPQRPQQRPVEPDAPALPPLPASAQRPPAKDRQIAFRISGADMTLLQARRPDLTPGAIASLLVTGAISGEISPDWMLPVVPE